MHIPRTDKNNLRYHAYKPPRQNLFMKYGRSPWLAAFLNLILWGSGYVYIGHRMILGIGLVVVSVLNFLILLSIPETILLRGSELFSLWLSFIWIALSFLFAADVYREANEINAI